MNTTRHSQGGAALGVALLMLVIITLLGIAAVRATQVELKLSKNAESNLAATQAAESLVAFIINQPGNLPVNGVPDYRTCVLPTTVRSGLPLFTCATNTLDVSTATLPLRTHGYALAQREPPLFVEVNVLRDRGFELSAKNYDFARFNVTGGYDRASDGLSAAEVTESILKLHAKVAGVNYEE